MSLQYAKSRHVTLSRLFQYSNNCSETPVCGDNSEASSEEMLLKEELLADDYRPQAVLKVEIPKPGSKGMRTLGIPTVVDRLI